MNKAMIRLLQLGYWLLYGFLVSFLFILSQSTDQSMVEDWDDWATILVATLLIGLSSFYAFYGWLVPRYLTTRRVKRFIGLGLLVSISIAIGSTLLVSLATTILLYLTLHQTHFLFFQLDDQLMLTVGFSLLAIINGMIGTAMRGSITWYTDIHLKERMANQALQTELSWLKSQLNPHFLFNTLNNIDILMERDASKASLYLNKLSDLLRFSLYETQADQIPLSQELASIEKYVELQRIRTPNEQYISLQIEGQAGSVLITPMLFMPYLENAFKYATNKKVTEAIRIYFRIDEAQIHFHCVNVIDPDRRVSYGYGGLGQKLLRQRLALLYPHTHTLIVESTDRLYSVSLTISLSPHALSTH